MSVVITSNIETDLDLANGSRGHIVAIALHEDDGIAKEEAVVNLSQLPAFILVRLEKKTKIPALRDLPHWQGVIPVNPMGRSFPNIVGNERKTVTRKQLPVTAAYAFTDYRSQGQTIDHAIVDIASPPSGRITPFNIYVALSRCRGRSSLWLLRDFDEKLVTTHPSEFLRTEDARLEKLDGDTERWWIGK